jgi:imidazolonepropionase-like amidohydrolase
MQKILTILLFLPLFNKVIAQPTFPNNGPADNRDHWFAFTNATIFKNASEKITNATLIIKDGKIESIGVGNIAPKGAVVYDLKGKYIYPSFIDMYADYGMPEPKAEGSSPAQQPQMTSNKKGAFAWNESLKSEFRANEAFAIHAEKAKEWRNAGFGATLSQRIDGVARGTATLVAVGEGREHEQILKANAANAFSFSKGSSTMAYPTSLMGIIALLRQTYLDAQWYKTQNEEYNASLEAWNNNLAMPQIFAVGNMFEVLRADKIAKEFGQKYIIKGNGDEYKRLEDIKKTGVSLIVPVKFPDAYDVEDPYDALQAELADLKHWELAPSNLARLEKANINFAITSAGLKDKKDFFAAIRKAIDNGLSETQALKALTETPAAMLGVTAQVGSLEKGKMANFLVTSGNIFDKETKIYENWVIGKNFTINNINMPLLGGNYDFNIEGKKYKFTFANNNEKTDLHYYFQDSIKVKADYALGNGTISIYFSPNNDSKNFTRLSGVLGEKWNGNGQNANGDYISWSATKITDPALEIPKKTDNKKENTPSGNIFYPALAYGNVNIPTENTYLIQNATVWTSEKEGILKNTDVLVQNGKITQIGKNIRATQVATIDGTDKHLTAGIIDEHSHIAVSRGVNEGSQESTAEVRVGDVVNADDVNIYRNLAGGVTAAHLLHGSANPIGGQTQLIKLRWGYAPEQMKMSNWDGFIKFALGENVKASNAGDNYRLRYPQSRMGVEQVYEDYFTRAAEYATLKASGKPYRKDLDLEAIVEILEKKRFITCHSYVQSEINMLIKLAERHHFKVNTFTHILEGYKVADKMAAHGVGGSSFADWWDYKYEVYNAIPHNAAMMQQQGVLTAINSDDAEMSRRLNQEAAKTIEYGGVSELDAWNMVTINPAKLLHIDKQTGSVKVGKDADLVLWNASPLSIYAKAEKTFVDGIKFFDTEEDAQKRAAMKVERERIIQKMIVAKKNGDATIPIAKPTRRNSYHCDEIHEEDAH